MLMKNSLLFRDDQTPSLYRCVAQHRRMWRWIATQNRNVDKDDYIYRIYHKMNPEIDYVPWNCFACLYSRFNKRKDWKVCGLKNVCIFKWPKKPYTWYDKTYPMCFRSIFGIWNSYFNKQDIAMEIASLPLKKWNYGKYSW